MGQIRIGDHSPQGGIRLQRLGGAGAAGAGGNARPVQIPEEGLAFDAPETGEDCIRCAVLPAPEDEGVGQGQNGFFKAVAKGPNPSL